LVAAERLIAAFSGLAEIARILEPKVIKFRRFWNLDIVVSRRTATGCVGRLLFIARSLLR
jgi:hypothetical protein